MANGRAVGLIQSGHIAEPGTGAFVAYVERLNDTEKLIGPQSPARGVQMSEEDLAAEIEKQRTLNLMRASFPSSS